MKSSFPLSQKYIDFINSTKNVEADFLEGTTASGKTTVGAGVKFMNMVSASKKKIHIIASKTTGTAEKNIIQQDNGLMDIHKGKITYHGNGDKDYKIPHLKFEGKIIFILGYDNVDKWQLILGSQFGCVFIDEINTANIDFVRELSTRNDYLMATLNPDDPEILVYKEFVNRSRPYNKYKEDVPDEIIKELTEEPVKTWKYWFFTFEDNLSLSENDIKKKKRSAPKGTKLYKNKIQGLRGRAEGLIFPNFTYENNVISEMQAKHKEYVLFSLGVDTSYSQKSDDTVSFIFQGLTNKGELVILEEIAINNKGNKEPFSPSDIAQRLFTFADYCKNKWGFSRSIFVDSADQATITELYKLKRSKPNSYNILNSDKTVKIIDRINLMLGWIKDKQYLVVEHCTTHIHEMNTYSWKDGKPEDANDHTINASQYGFIPIRDKVGIEIEVASTRDKIKQAKKLFR